MQTLADTKGYAVTADRMLELAAEQPGFPGVESLRDPNGVGITVSYWSSRESIRSWRDQVEHRAAQSRGHSNCYIAYRLRICRVERDVHFSQF